MRLHYLQHVSFENPGSILEWAEVNVDCVTSTHFYEDDVILPGCDDIDFLVVMGGPMGVYDAAQYPWLKEEKGFIRDFIKTGKPVLGICLGAQLLADCLGASIRSGVKEIGWAPVQKNESGRFFTDFRDGQVVFHWHGDTFDLPDGAKCLASTQATRNQAFEYQNCLGLQFHFEMQPDNIRLILENATEDLDGSTYVQSVEEILQETRYFEENKAVLFSILDRMAETI